jgi:hypothetical protein
MNKSIGITNVIQFYDGKVNFKYIMEFDEANKPTIYIDSVGNIWNNMMSMKLPFSYKKVAFEFGGYIEDLIT